MTDRPTPNQTTRTDFSCVDFTIAGTRHRITCPSDRTDSVKQTAERLHNNLIELRQQVKGKSPNNEELLVLHCLDLYDQISELKTRQKFSHDNEQRAEALLEKILKNAKSVL